jgi:hypothetical protein
MTRPASVKWTMAILAVMALVALNGALAMFGGNAPLPGNALYNAAPSILLASAALAAIIGLWRGRSWGRVTASIVFAVALLLAIVQGVVLFHSVGMAAVGFLIQPVVLALPLGYLVYRIWMGAPSKRYFAVVSDSR